jgi:transposase, IS5 family
MGQERTVQASIFDVFAEHEIGRELKAMSDWLDGHRGLLGLVAADLRREGVKETGRQGLPAEAVLRCALLKQYRQLSYEELAFHLEDSASFRAFARLPWAWSPRKSVLQQTISAIRAGTWEAINRTLLLSARREKLEKKRWRALEFTRGRPQRVQLYRELIKITRTTLAYLRQAAAQPGRAADPLVALWQLQVRHFEPLIEQIITQTERRVLAGEAVPAGDKLVSLFEPHADIIVKGREVAYGHKLNLTAGKSGLILDLVIEAGNPADSERLLPMLERHIAVWGAAPRQAAADGGFASRNNLAEAKARGVEDMAFHKKAGLRIEDMVCSHWVYRKLRNFRAGIEAGISCLKRAYGLARCTWRGLDHFKAYVWSSVVAYTLALFARLRPA